MKYAEAKERADELVERMRIDCERIEIAGSIRRQKLDDIKDVEIVAVPKWHVSPDPGNLFGEGELRVNLLWQNFQEVSGIAWIKPGAPGIEPWRIRSDGKYWRGLLPGDIKLDLFIATPANFGLIFLIRTGSAEFSEAVVTHAKRIGRPVKGGYLRRWSESEQAIPTPEEHDVFEFLNLEYVEPRDRIGRDSLRGKR